MKIFAYLSTEYLHVHTLFMEASQYQPSGYLEKTSEHQWGRRRRGGHREENRMRQIRKINTQLIPMTHSSENNISTEWTSTIDSIYMSSDETRSTFVWSVRNRFDYCCIFWTIFCRTIQVVCLTNRLVLDRILSTWKALAWYLEAKIGGCSLQSSTDVLPLIRSA